MTAENTKSAVVTAVAKKFSLTEDDIMGRRRTERIALARMICMAAVWQAGFSYCVVGRVFKRHHGTVMHAVKKTNAKRECDESEETPTKKNYADF